MPSWSVLLVCATSVHAGFQLTISRLVYSALLRVPRERFGRAHADHSRAIVPLVALVYGAPLLTAAGAVVSDPRSLLGWAAAASTLLAPAVTAFRAAPLHGRLGRQGPEPALVRALVRADHLRTLGALVAVGVAVAYASHG